MKKVRTLQIRAIATVMSGAAARTGDLKKEREEKYIKKQV